jgi:hypothetical protein
VQRSIRDRDADGDNAVLKSTAASTPTATATSISSRPTPSSTASSSSTRSRPATRRPAATARTKQAVDAANLSEGYHFVEVRAFRHRDDGGPAVYSSFKETIYVDRFKPVSAVDSFHTFGNSAGDNDVWVRSLDLTGHDVRVFLNLPAGLSEAQIPGDGGWRTG